MATTSTSPQYSVIPLDSSPDQKLITTIPVNGQNITLQLRIRFNDQAGYWWMDISDQYGNLILPNVPLLCGQYPAADLLGQYQYLNIGSAVLVSQSSTQDSPNDATLGANNGFTLLWGDSAALWGGA